MPLNQETLAKLTTSLAGDIDLYNTVLAEVQNSDATLAEKQLEIDTANSKLEDSEKRGQQYLAQVSNLLTKIPVGNSSTPLSLEEKFEEVKNRSWAK